MTTRFLALIGVLALGTSAAAQSNAGWLRYPSISPDGKTIVFTYKGDLYRVAATGGTAIPLTTHQAHDFMPVWSRDGRQIAFASDRYGNFDIFVMPAEGGEARRLTFHSVGTGPGRWRGGKGSRMTFCPELPLRFECSPRISSNPIILFVSYRYPLLFQVISCPYSQRRLIPGEGSR
jgi:hypothetical protein